MILRNGKEIMTLKEALISLEEEFAKKETTHISGNLLYSFLMGCISPEERENILRHLSLCKRCRSELWHIYEAVQGQEISDSYRAQPAIYTESIIDVALPLAADSPKDSSFSFLTEGGRFRIMFDKLIEEKNKGVISIKIEPRFQREIEGKKIVVMDDTGREILRARVVNGETPGKVVSADEIPWKDLIVREDLS